MEEVLKAKEVRILNIKSILFKIYKMSKRGMSISKIQEALKNDLTVVKDMRDTRDVEYQIPAHQEYDKQKTDELAETPFIKEFHNFTRSAIFALEDAHEHMLDGAKIIIYDDDPAYWRGTRHAGTYILKLHNDDEYLHAGKASGKVQDFDSIFIHQKSFFGKNPEGDNTTLTAYDSYIHEYAIPVREFDAKSHLWTTGKNSHNVHYVIRAVKDSAGNFKNIVGRIEYDDKDKPIFREVRADIFLDNATSRIYAEEYTFIAELIDSGILDMIPYESVLGE